jgi:hypothetical protein
VIWGKRKPECFSKRDWATQITLIRLGKLDFTRKATEPHGRLQGLRIAGSRRGQRTRQGLAITKAKLLKVY